MKTLLAFAIILCAVVKVNGQHIDLSTPNNNGAFKLKPVTPLDTNLIWHLPKTSDALKQIPKMGFYNKPTIQLPDANALMVYSTMPVKHLSGYSKMPILPLGPGDNMPVKKVTIINPLDVVTP